MIRSDESETPAGENVSAITCERVSKYILEHRNCEDFTRDRIDDARSRFFLI